MEDNSPKEEDDFGAGQQNLNPSPRACGTCYSCCLNLGITELKKYPTQTCKHLDGTIPDKRCTIYSTRPRACSRYNCSWIEGLGDDDARPDKSGILITPYPSPDLPFPNFTSTIIISDETKAGNLSGPSYLNSVINNLLSLNCHQIRIVNYKTKIVYLIQDRKIYLGKLIKTKNYEELSFAINRTPIGSYTILEQLPPKA